MIVLMLLIFAAGALALSRNAASHLTAETIAKPTATPMIPHSVIGVSITRRGPNSSSRPCVTL